MIKISLSIVIMICSGCFNSEEPPKKPKGLLKPLWEYNYNINGWGTESQPMFIGDSLLLVTGDEYISCIRIDKGNIKWRYPLPGGSRSTIQTFLFDDYQFYGWQLKIYEEKKYRLYALSLETGQVNWSLDSVAYYEKHGLSPNYYYSPFGFTFFKITLTGDVIDTIRSNHPHRNLSYYSSKVFSSQGWPCGAEDCGRIICYDEKTLDSLWSYDAPGGGFNLCYPIFDNEVLYVGTVWGNNNKAIALNAETGEELWSTPMRCYAMLLEGDVLYVTETHWVHALDKFTGEILWSSELFFSTDEQHSMGYFDGYVYVDHYGLLYILDAATGEIVEEMQGPDNAPVVMVTAGKDKIIVQSNKHVYCFEPYGSN